MPCDNTGSGTEVVFATVATLSKDVFEAPHKDRHDLQYPSPMVAASRSENTLPQSKSLKTARLEQRGLPTAILISQSDTLLSNIVDIPALTISSHGGSPNPDSPPPDIFKGHSQSASRTRLPSSSFVEPADQITLCVIQIIVTYLTH